MTIKRGAKLTKDEVIQINESLLREFKQTFSLTEESKGRLYFLLKDRGIIIAIGALGEISPVLFDEETYSLYGIYNVISNIKDRGLGREVVTVMRDHLISHDKIGLGFCMPNVAGFYEKCGFKIEKNSTKRFVYSKHSKKITNQDGQYIFYQDSSIKFMEKVLSKPSKDVLLPTDNLW